MLISAGQQVRSIGEYNVVSLGVEHYGNAQLARSAMALRTRPQTTQTEYVRAPWHLRLRWWFASWLWCWCRSFEETSVESPDLANPLWRR